MRLIVIYKKMIEILFIILQLFIFLIIFSYPINTFNNSRIASEII